MLSLINLETEQPIEFKTWKFPAGEIGVRVESEVAKNADVLITTGRHIDPSSDTFMTILLLIDAFQQMCVRVHVELPYMPYGRQDKVHAKGEPRAVYLMARLLRIAGACTISTLDGHSNVQTIYSKVPALLPKLVQKYDTIVFPDAGAKTRYTPILKGKHIVYAKKVRNKETGEIVDYRLEGVPSGRILVVDDICDGGRTFIELGKLLPYKADLYVTHGIFSKGKEELRKYYRKFFHITGKNS